MAIDLVLNRHKKIQNMSIEEMAEYLATFGCCHLTGDKCHLCESCTQCWKEFLQGSDN